MFMKTVCSLLCSTALIACGSSSNSHDSANDTDLSLDGGTFVLTEGSFTLNK